MSKFLLIAIQRTHNGILQEFASSRLSQGQKIHEDAASEHEKCIRQQAVTELLLIPAKPHIVNKPKRGIGHDTINMGR